MAKNVLAVLLTVLALLVGVKAVARDNASPVPDQTVQVEFPVAWMEMMIAAYTDFRKMTSDTSCFNISARREGAMYLIAIAPPLGVHVEGDKITIPVVPGDSRCGRGMHYYFDSTGSLVKRVGLR